MSWTIAFISKVLILQLCSSGWHVHFQYLLFMSLFYVCLFNSVGCLCFLKISVRAFCSFVLRAHFKRDFIRGSPGDLGVSLPREYYQYGPCLTHLPFPSSLSLPFLGGPMNLLCCFSSYSESMFVTSPQHFQVLFFFTNKAFMLISVP